MSAADYNEMLQAVLDATKLSEEVIRDVLDTAGVPALLARNAELEAANARATESYAELSDELGVVYRRSAEQARTIEQLRTALRYISQPTMGFPGDGPWYNTDLPAEWPDPEKWLHDGYGIDSNIRAALETCIRMARAVLSGESQSVDKPKRSE